MRRLYLCAALLCAACAEDSPCVERLEQLHGCGVHFKDEICDTSRGECAVACYSTVECSVLKEVFFEEKPAPEALDHCWAQCIEPFRCDDGATTINADWRCDAEADCRDGTDERGCAYFECTDGQLVRESASCDDWEECNDGSDEEGCE